MNDILEILKYTLPSIVVLLTAWLLIRLFLKNEDKKRKFEISMNQKDTTLPLRLQAYERLILLLERISPDSLVMRHNSGNSNVAKLQNELVAAVRQEFEHNLAQQTYISISAWEKVKSVRSEIIKMINMSAAELRPGDPGVNLSKRILEKAMELEQSPTQEATRILKAEVQELF